MPGPPDIVHVFIYAVIAAIIGIVALVFFYVILRIGTMAVLRSYGEWRAQRQDRYNS